MRFHSSFRILPLLASALLAAACTHEVNGTSEGNAFAGSAAAQLTVTSQQPVPGSAAGASYTVSASFTTAPVRCATTTEGACTYNPCSRPPAAGPAGGSTSAGAVTLTGASAGPFSLQPQADGTYASESAFGELPWTAGGQSVTFAWSHFPGDPNEAGDALTIGTPPYIALGEGSAFAANTGTLARTDDLTVSWTSDTAADPTDQVVVDVNAGSAQIYCVFPAAAGTGVVTAAALANLEKGPVSYSVHSKRAASKQVSAADGTAWSLSFNVDATARTSEGLASGWLTLE